MSKDIFISYSRRDQEFVTRLASDVNAQVAGVWFDHSEIQIGEKWHDEIMEGIRECKAFILVLSPDAAESKYVREEVDKALELGRPIFPIVYRPARWSGELQELVKDIQTLDLRSGSYIDNFHKLVDGLIEAGAIKAATYERPFLREPAKISLKVVFSKALRWAFAWSLGWLIFWSMTFIFLFIIIALQNRAGWEDILNFLTISFSGMAGGLAGGMFAGLFSMLVLRPYAPSISWKHMSPTIRIWAVSGPLGMIISSVITVVMLAIGVISTQSEIPNCERSGFNECIRQIFRSAVMTDRDTIILIITVFIAFLTVTWFLNGILVGWLVVRHIRKLEPGITTRQAWGVSTGWGCGAIVAAVSMFVLLVMISSALGL